MTLNSTESQPLRTSRSIQEFRIDFLLEEEFSADPRFAKEFMAACASALSFTGVERVVHSLPIRLMQTPATCRVCPCAGIKVGISRRLNPARDAEQRAEGVERVEPPVEAERELIEVGL